jgi:hypothetical protein
MRSVGGARVGVFSMLVVLASMAGAFSPPAAAQLYDHRWALNFGGELARFSTTARLDSEELGIGTEIDLEDDLGLDDRRVNLRFDGAYRFSRKNQVVIGYSQRVRKNTHILERDIEWGGVTYPVDAEVKTRFANNLLRAGWKHSLLSTDTVEAGFGLGVSAYWMTSRISGEGQVSGEEAQYELRESEVVAPIPVAGLFLNWAVSRTAVLRVAGDYFDASYQHNAGTLADFSTAFEVMPWEKVGLGLAYNWSKLEYVAGEKSTLSVDFTTELLFGYIRVVF